MNILVFQQAAWDNTNSVGNTLSNWFSGWDEDTFANFYTRKQVPNNSIVSHYYTVSALELLKSFLKGRKSKRHFSAAELQIIEDEIQKHHEIEQASIDNLHKNNNEIIYWGMETIWRSKIWIDKQFKDFIQNFKPDIFFAFCTSVYILHPLILYLKRNTNVKVVLFIADDVYGDYEKKSFFRRGYLKRYFEMCVNNADHLYGVSRELCDEYSRIFGKHIEPLYKGCTINDLSTEKKLNHPIKIVYAGNLLYGRADTLGRLADSLSAVNESGTKAILEIYTGSTITEEIENKLSRPGTSYIMGKRPFDEIRNILSDAEIVLHIESFDHNQIEYVHYSFSTKIIDCLECGSLVLAIGPAGISSIEYIRKVPGAVVIDNMDDLNQEICNLLAQKNEFKSMAEKIRMFASENHEISKVRNSLREDFDALLQSTTLP